MMQLLGFITLVFDGNEVRYKLYHNPSDKRFHFKPEATISLYPSFTAWRLKGDWAFEGGVHQHIQQQLIGHLTQVRKQKESPLL
jgi:hypothetical protein